MAHLRLKHLLESWSLEKYLEETEKLLGYNLLRVPAILKSEIRNPKFLTPTSASFGRNKKG